MLCSSFDAPCNSCECAQRRCCQTWTANFSSCGGTTPAHCSRLAWSKRPCCTASLNWPWELLAASAAGKLSRSMTASDTVGLEPAGGATICRTRGLGLSQPWLLQSQCWMMRGALGDATCIASRRQLTGKVQTAADPLQLNIV